jgi:hypothetical protein
MRILVVHFATFIAALSLFSVGALASISTDTMSATSSDMSELPTACKTTATPTATTTSTPTAADDEMDDEADGGTGQPIRACIMALHQAGDHGIGQTISELAHELHAERAADREAEDDRDHGDGDDVPAVVSVTPTATASPTATSASSVEPARTARGMDQNPMAKHGHGRKHGRD